MLREVIQGLLMNSMFQDKPNCFLRPCLHGLLLYKLDTKLDFLFNLSRMLEGVKLAVISTLVAT